MIMQSRPITDQSRIYKLIAGSAELSPFHECCAHDGMRAWMMAFRTRYDVHITDLRSRAPQLQGPDSFDVMHTASARAITRDLTLKSPDGAWHNEVEIRPSTENWTY